MSNVKDLVDEHFTRALSNVANKQRHFPPLVEQQLCGPSLLNRGVKKETSSSVPSTTSTPSPMSHTPTSLVLSPQTYLHSHRHGKAPIVYPEFVQFLVHPGVDSFRDIPRLPGQSQQITTTPKGWESHSAKETPRFAPATNAPLPTRNNPTSMQPLLHTSHSGPELTREDLKAILDLNDNVI